MGKADNRIKVSIPPNIKAQLQAIADQRGVDLAPMIAQAAIEKYLGHKGAYEGSQEDTSEVPIIGSIEARLSRLEYRLDRLEGLKKGPAQGALEQDSEGASIEGSEENLRGAIVGDSIPSVEGSVEEVPKVPVDELSPLSDTSNLGSEQIKRDDFRALWGLDNGAYSRALVQCRQEGSYTAPDGSKWVVTGKKNKAVWSKQS